ncbi:MAG: hypothetical protein QM644_04555 [Mobilitalea sp.]
MIKTKAIRGTVIVLAIISMVGCGNREEHSNKTLVMNQNAVANGEEDIELTGTQISERMEVNGRANYEDSVTEGTRWSNS